MSIIERILWSDITHNIFSGWFKKKKSVLEEKEKGLISENN